MSKEALEGNSSMAEKLKQENELLLLQLRQAQEELEYYFIKYKEITDDGKNINRREIGDVAKSDKKKLSSVVLDLRQLIDGENWYSAEHDGRWAGPNTISTLRLPSLPIGHYRLELEVVDAIAPEILRGMKVSVNGKPLELKGLSGLVGPWGSIVRLYRKRQKYPLLLRSDFLLPSGGQDTAHYLEFSFPGTISPISRGAQDSRNLAVRLKKVKISYMQEQNTATDRTESVEGLEPQLILLEKESQRAKAAEENSMRLARYLEQKELEMQLLNGQVKEREERIQSLEARDKGNAQVIQSLEDQVKEKNQEILSLETRYRGNDQTIQSLKDQVKERDQAIQSLEARSRGDAQVIQSLKDQVKERDQAIQSLEDQVKEKDQIVESLKEHVNRDNQVIQSLDGQVKDKDQTIQSLDSDLARAQQTANLSSKMALLRESDLKDLRQRYKEALQTQEQQHCLLSKLEERLHAAASYFHRLSDISDVDLVIEKKGKKLKEKGKKRRKNARSIS